MSGATATDIERSRTSGAPWWGPLVVGGLLLLRLNGRTTTWAAAHAPGRSRPASERAAAKAAPHTWFGFLKEVVRELGEERLIAVAAGVTFYSLLAIFPAVAALVALYGLVADPAAITAHVNATAGLLPEGAVQVIRDEVDRIAAQPGRALGTAFAVGLLVSIWSANGGVKALFDALNVVHNERERRGFVRLNATSLAFVIGGLVFVILALSAMVALPVVLDRIGIGSMSRTLLSIGRWPALLVVVALFIALVYRFGPDRRNPRWRWITWGSAFASIGWIVVSLLFSWYTSNFGSYNRTYGSLGAVIGFMTWMWISTIVILVGAEVDSILEHQETGKGTDARPVAVRR